MPRASRRQYNQVPSADQEADGTEDDQGRSRGHENSLGVSNQEQSLATDKKSGSDKDGDVKPLLEGLTLDEETAIDVVILDSAQKKFPIRVDPQWTVLQLKQAGESTHKVAPPQQRLIYRGKLLVDGASLQSCGIVHDKTIVHLFPKPRVVVTSSSINSSCEADASDAPNNGGAHIPQIVLNEDEAERRGQILVLGSHEVAEAQNNVKLLSLLLLVVCSMRLLALFSIAMGIAEDPSAAAAGSASNSTHNHTHFTNDDNYGPTDSETDYQFRTWETNDYYDLLVSGIGFYVATLGMKATNENTLHLANAYLVGTIIAGIAWNIWNTFMYADFVITETEKSHDPATSSSESLTRDDFITVAFFTVLLPLLVWTLCCFRAFEFRNLLREAEEEAADRMQSQLNLEEGSDTNDESSHEMTEINPGRTSVV